MSESDLSEECPSEVSHKAKRSTHAPVNKMKKYLLLISVVAAIPVADYFFGPLIVAFTIVVLSLPMYLYYLKYSSISYNNEHHAIAKGKNSHAAGKMSTGNYQPPSDYDNGDDCGVNTCSEKDQRSVRVKQQNFYDYNNYYKDVDDYDDDQLLPSRKKRKQKSTDDISGQLSKTTGTAKVPSIKLTDHQDFTNPYKTEKRFEMPSSEYSPFTHPGDHRLFPVKIMGQANEANNQLQNRSNLFENSLYDKSNKPSVRTTIRTGHQIPYEPKHGIRSKCKVIKGTDPQIYLLPLNLVSTTDTFRLRKCVLGETILGKTEKVIIMVGATGSGKTTLINGMINYILGVNWEDNFRFQMIPDPDEIKGKSQAVSQTKWITAYTIHHQNGFKVPYTLTVIDTPGFGDTGGIDQDKKTMQEISYFFRKRGKQGIDHLTAVGIVVEASNARLTNIQRFIFDSILSIFGKDMTRNIFAMITFSDGQNPPVLTALENSNVPFCGNFYKFNNSALYAKKPENESQRQICFDSIFWAMGKDSFDIFFDHLKQVEDQSLVLTKQVLEERQHLELSVDGIQKQLNLGLNKLNRLQTEINVLTEYQADIERNKKFEYSVVEDVVMEEAIPIGKYITNCTFCNFTCHYPCKIPSNEFKRECAAIKDSRCQICPGKCSWKLHENKNYRLVVTSKAVWKTSDDLKARYRKATGNRVTTEKLIEQLANEFDWVQMHVLYLIDQIRKSIMHIQDIALKPVALSALEYIDILVESESDERRDGWEDRVFQLRTARKQAELIYDCSNDSFDPFRDYKETYEMYLKRGQKPDISSLFQTIRSAEGTITRSVRQVFGQD